VQLFLSVVTSKAYKPCCSTLLALLDAWYLLWYLYRLTNCAIKKKSDVAGVVVPLINYSECLICQKNKRIKITLSLDNEKTLSFELGWHKRCCTAALRADVVLR
jgi:hypothetical protein